MWSCESLVDSDQSDIRSLTRAKKAALPTIALFVLLVPIRSNAQSCPGTVPAGMECIAHGATREITAGDCLRITNSHAKGKAMMIPIKTPAQWLSFKTNLPAGVTTAACTASACTPGVQTFDTPGTGSFTVPAGCTSLTVEVWGGGGAGSKGYTDFDFLSGMTVYSGGIGGGAGGYSRLVASVTPGQSIAYVVGAGGISFSTHGAESSALGATGAGGETSIAADENINGTAGPYAGTGGSASGGTTNSTGASGGTGSAAFDCMGGWWGGGYGGDSPSGGTGGAGGLTTAGSPGGTPGAGGGGGAYDCDASVGNTGGNGANGRVKFSY